MEDEYEEVEPSVAKTALFTSWCREEAEMCQSPFHQTNNFLVPEWAIKKVHEDPSTVFAKDLVTILSHPRTKGREVYMEQLIRGDEKISKAELAYYAHLTKKVPLPKDDEIPTWQLELAFLLHFPTALAEESGPPPQYGMGLQAIAMAAKQLRDGIYIHEGALNEVRKSIESSLLAAGMIDMIQRIEEIDPIAFEEKIMKDFPDYFGVLMRMGLQPVAIPIDIAQLPPSLLDAFNRAAVRKELALMSRRVKTDLKFANTMFEKKYTRRNKELPYIPAAKELIGDKAAEDKAAMLPDWLPPADKLAPKIEPLKKDLVETLDDLDSSPLAEPLKQKSVGKKRKKR